MPASPQWPTLIDDAKTLDKLNTAIRSMELLDTGNKTVDRCRHCLQILVTATTRIGTSMLSRQLDILACANKNAQGTEVFLATIPCWTQRVLEMSSSTATSLVSDSILVQMMTSRGSILINSRAWVYRNCLEMMEECSCKLPNTQMFHCYLDAGFDSRSSPEFGLDVSDDRSRPQTSGSV